MTESLLLVGVIIAACILLSGFAEKLPVPSLLIFIGLGMLFGENGPLGITFNDYALSESVCTVCMVALAPICARRGRCWPALLYFPVWGCCLPHYW